MGDNWGHEFCDEVKRRKQTIDVVAYKAQCAVDKSIEEGSIAEDFKSALMRIYELQSRIEAVRKCPEVVTINDDHRSHLYMEEEICLRKSDVLKALGGSDGWVQA